MSNTGADLLVLGLGNVLLGDDGVGPAAVARLRDGYGETNLLEYVPGDARAERMQVQLDIRQLGQLLSVDQGVPTNQPRHRRTQPQRAALRCGARRARAGADVGKRFGE